MNTRSLIMLALAGILLAGTSEGQQPNPPKAEEQKQVVQPPQQESSGKQSQADPWARGLAVLGIVLAVFNWFWDWYKFNRVQEQRDQDRQEQLQQREEDRREREEQQQEKVEASLSLSRSVQLGEIVLTVRLLSRGNFPIRIKAVSLKFIPTGLSFTPEGGEALHFPEPVGSLGFGTFQRVPPENFRPVLCSSVLLPEREEVFFILSKSSVPPGFLNSILSIAKDKVWIEVGTPSREIARIDGGMVLDLIRTWIQADQERKAEPHPF